MVFSNEFQELIAAIFKGDITNEHLRAFVANPNRVLDASAAVSALEAQTAFVAPRAAVTVEQLRTGRANFGDHAESNGNGLWRVEHRGLTYVVAGEAVWGPFDTVRDLQWAAEKPLYGAASGSAWQVFHGDVGSTTYAGINFLSYVDDLPLYAAQCASGKWSVVHGTTMYRQCDAIRTSPRIANGKPLYIALIGADVHAMCGNQRFGKGVDGIYGFLAEGQPVYTVGGQGYWKTLYVGEKRMTAPGALFSVLGVVDDELVYVARTNDSKAWCAYHGEKIVAEGVREEASLADDILSVTRARWFGRDQPLDIPLHAPKQLAAGTARLGPYRKG